MIGMISSWKTIKGKIRYQVLNELAALVSEKIKVNTHIFSLTPLFSADWEKSSEVNWYFWGCMDW